MSFAEKGAVADIDPAFFIGYLHRLKATGTLKLEDSPIQRAIYFRDGRVLFSSSNAPEDQLGAILVAGGKISQEQFDALVLALEPKQSIAAALAQGGHVSQRDIGDAARRKVEQIVGACCSQTSGRYEFEDGILPKGALDLKLTTEKVLVSAFEALEPSGFLIRILKSPMAVLAPADVEPSEPELARLRGALDGFSSLADAGGMVGLSPAATEVRAAVLVVLGAATVVTSQIEEMALPDTGETAPGLPSMSLSDDAETFEADTIGFGQAAADSGLSLVEEPLAASPASGMSGDVGSSDATLVMASGLEIAPPSGAGESGAMRMGTPPKQKATTQDLAAVKELIGAPQASPRPNSGPVPTRSWEPVLSAAGRPVPTRGFAAVIHNPVFQRAVGLGLLLAVGTLAWTAYSVMSARPRPTPTPAAVAPAVTPSVPNAAGVQPSALAVPPTAATGPATAASPSMSPAAVGAAPTATPASAKPVVTATPQAAAPAAPSPVARMTPIPATPPKATPVQTPASTPAATATPAAKPATSATTTATTTAATTPAPKAALSGSPYDAMKAGSLAGAATAFLASAKSRSDEFSILLLVACSPQTVAKAIQNDPSADLYILPTTLASKPCHRIMRGFFKTENEAKEAVSSLPGYYTAEGARPRAVSVRSVLR